MVNTKAMKKRFRRGEICTAGSVRGGSVGAARVDLSEHAAGNGGYSQGTPTEHRPLLLGEMFGYSANVNCGKSVSGESGDMSESPESSSFRVE